MKLLSCLLNPSLALGLAMCSALVVADPIVHEAGNAPVAAGGEWIQIFDNCVLTNTCPGMRVGQRVDMTEWEELTLDTMGDLLVSYLAPGIAASYEPRPYLASEQGVAVLATEFDPAALHRAPQPQRSLPYYF